MYIQNLKQFFLIQQYTPIQKMIQGRNMNLNKLFLCNIIFKKSWILNS